LNEVINPLILYALLALGGVGVYIALPRRGVNPQILGGLLAAIAAGLIVLILTVKAHGQTPNLYFYIFAAVALAGALRVITHPRPVYAALYFILTVLASAGLFVLLAAEFLAFALIIVYAGAILITYLFVIMLATQAPSEDQVEVLADYDASSNEPVAATFVGFLFLAVLTTMFFGEHGLNELPPPATRSADQALIDELPGKVETAEAWQHVAPVAPERPLAVAQPQVDNIEGVAFSLLRDHPGSIEIAGIILLMAMLGAVVLARKQVQLDEEAKARHAALLSDQTGGAA
jgi:NADH-quinone oxidoreductase subunit J